jgi:dTMP kinase
MRGLLIALEGVDRSGKSTQTQMLENYLNEKHKKTEIIKFPDRTTTFGKEIDSFLKNKKKIEDKLVHLLFSINRWELKEKIISLLNEGVNVILDRYSYSGVAYSHAKGIDFDWCLSPEKGLPKPDLVFYFKIDNLEEITKRKEYGEEVYENIDFQNKVKQVYEKELLEDSWVIVDALQSIEKVSEFINTTVDENLEQQRKEIQFI